MTLCTRISDRLTERFRDLPGTEITVSERTDGGVVTVRAHGEGGVTILVPVRVAGETVTPGEPTSSGPGGAIPSGAEGLASLVRDRVHGSDLQELVLSPLARSLLDGLRDIAVAQAREDEEALSEAIENGRQVVLTYRPSLANLLPPPVRGPRP